MKHSRKERKLRVPGLGLVVLALGLAVSLGACGDDEEDSIYGADSPRIYDADSPRDPGRIEVENPLVGAWSSGGCARDWYYERSTQQTAGSGCTGSGYFFEKDGTYIYFISSTGYGIGTMSGWVLFEGKYKTAGDQITFYERYGSSNNSPQRTPSKDETKTFEFRYSESTQKSTLVLKDFYVDSKGKTQVKEDSFPREAEAKE